MACGTHGKIVLAGVLALSAVAASAPAAAVVFFEGIDPNTLQPRRALVIAVPTVRHAAGFQPLDNPINDSVAVTKTLESIGFSFTQNLAAQFETTEMTRRTIKNAIYDFATELKGTDTIGLVYFAGHGIERDDGRRYLVPYDGLVRYERDLEDELIPVEFIYDAFREAGTPLNFLILDTCRNNPFAEKLATFASGHESSSKRKRPPKNVVILSSTLSGDVAADGAGNLSPFAQAFIDGIREWDKRHTTVLDDISSRIETYSSPNASYQIGELILRGSGGFVFAPSKTSYDAEKNAWQKLAQRKRVNIREIEEHQYQYRGGYFHGAATKAIEELHGRGQQVTSQATMLQTVTVLQPGWRVRATPAGRTIDFTPPTAVAVLPAAPPIADPQTGNKSWWPVQTDVGLSYIASGAFRNLPNVKNYVTIPINKGTTATRVPAEVAGITAYFTPIQNDPANPERIKVASMAPPIAKVSIPLEDPEDPQARANAWLKYLDKALELEKAGVDLSQAVLEFVKSSSPEPVQETVAQISYWTATNVTRGDVFVGAVPVDNDLFRSRFGEIN